MIGHITVAAQQGTEGTGYMLQADMQAAAAVAEIQPSAFYASGGTAPTYKGHLHSAYNLFTSALSSTTNYLPRRKALGSRTLRLHA